jgi:hypothetical protein
MLDSMFVETMSRAISDYRQILKKYLTPAQRAGKIAELRLKDPTIFNDEPTLYQVVQNILRDIENNIRVPNEGYYSYYGIARFAKFLREYVDNYSIEGDIVIHKAQRAANLLIKAIQLLSLPGEQLTENVAQEVLNAHPLIIELSSKEQLAIYNSTLERLSERNKAFYRKIVFDFQTRLNAVLAEAA